MIGVLALFIGLQAAAQVPYAKLEVLRQKSTVVRVALDSPDNPRLKKCAAKSDDFAALGGRLALAMDEAGKSWKSQTLRLSDMATLKDKISSCANRGSCQVYEAFLSAVQSAPEVLSEVETLKKTLNEKLEKLESSSYQKALLTVPDACAVLKTLS